MNRREFLQSLAAVTTVALLPALPPTYKTTISDDFAIDYDGTIRWVGGDSDRVYTIVEFYDWLADAWSIDDCKRVFIQPADENLYA